MTSYADQWIDPDMTLSPADLADWSTALWPERKLGFLVDDFKMFGWASQIPRRISGADGAALALDKKRCRAGMHLMANLIQGWATLCPGWDHNAIDPANVSLDVRQRGAQLRWDDWLLVSKENAELERARYVTVGLQAGERAWVNQTAALFTREINQLSRLDGTYR